MLDLPRKHLRALVVRDYLTDGGKTPARGVVCFSCGNAAEALRRVGLDVLEVGPRGTLSPRQWFTAGQIARFFPDRFDATSGHLPLPLMVEYGKALRQHLGRLPHEVDVLCGSGETAVALAIEYVGETWVNACYDNRTAHACYDEQAPLNGWVKALCGVRQLDQFTR